jgi:dienelactone hydrolase
MRYARLPLAMVLVLLHATAQVNAAEPRPGDAAIEKHLAQETFAVSQGVLAGASSKEAWEAQRGELKRQYLDMLGLWPLPQRTPLKAQVTGRLERDAFTVEKVHFQSKPGLYVTGNLYRPKLASGGRQPPDTRLPAVLYVCGHSGRGRDGNKTAFQHHGMWFATHGYVCLIIDTLQLGEVAGIHHGTYSHNRWWWQAAGYTPAGVECWNGVRAIDYLLSRPEVDPERIAVTGISGGGAATLWITAADERVRVCVPVSGMSDLESYVTDKIINGHCDCMFLYNAYRWEWTTIAALVAPRPMLFENSGHDTIFPMPGNERIRERLERLYGWYQKKPGELFDIGITPGGHEDNLELRLMAYRWINRHLKKDNAEVSEPPLPRFEGKQLRVFPEDSDLPKDSVNAKIDETFVPRATPKPPTSKQEYADWSKRLREELLERVFHDWPEEISAAKVREAYPDGRVVLMTDETVPVMAARMQAMAKGATRSASADKNRRWLVVLNADEPEGKLPGWTKGQIPAGEPVVVLSPRGCGETFAYTRKNPPNYVERSHLLLGRTVDTGRVWDVQATARWLHETGGENVAISVIGRGPAGVIGTYAALWEPAIGEIVLVDPPSTHQGGPIFLNVLRVLDIPDALALLAPRTVRLINAKDAAFDRTVQSFKAAGYGQRIERK